MLVVYHFPAGLARDVDSAAGGAGFADRHVRRFPAARVFRSTRFRFSGWCWRSAWWWTTPSSSSRRWSTTSKKACRRSDAALKAMEEVSGPVVAIALILAAVFVPDGFHSRHHRPALSAVRRDDRDLRDHLRVQRADAQSRALRRCCCRPQKASARPARRVSSAGSTASSAEPPMATSAFAGV